MHVLLSISAVSYRGKVSDVHITRWPMVMHFSKIFSGQPNATYFATSLKSWCPSLAKHKAMHLLQSTLARLWTIFLRMKSTLSLIWNAPNYLLHFFYVHTYMGNLNLQESIPGFKQTGISINIHYRILFVICLLQFSCIITNIVQQRDRWKQN